MKYKLSELFDLQMGKTPSRSETSYWNTCENKWIAIGDLSQSGKYICNTKEYISDKAIVESGIKEIPKNTVIMSFKLSIGKVAITSEKMYSNEAIMAFLDKKTTDLIPDYLYYLFSYRDWNEGTNKAVMGKTLNKTTLSKMQMYIHPMNQQEEIVRVLDKVYHIIDLQKEKLKKLDELIKSRFLEMFGDPVRNPMEWSFPLIEEVVAHEKNALKAGPFGSALKKEFYVEAGYKIYGQEQVINDDPMYGSYYIDEERYKTLKNYAVKAGDVLISLVGTYGKLLIMPENFEPGIINPRLMKITFDRIKVNPIYFKYYFQSDSLKQALSENTHGGTMDILNLGIVRKLQIPLPPMELQKKFAAFVHQIDKSKLTIQKSLEKLETLKKSLMQQYFG